METEKKIFEFLFQTQRRGAALGLELLTESEIMLFMDPSGRCWETGHATARIQPMYIPLPFYGDSMYPREILDPSVDYVYCTCAKCTSFIATGIVTLEVSPKRWGVCLLCTDCCGSPHWGREARPLGFPIVQVMDRLSRNMEQAYICYRTSCSVCGKSKCRDPSCKEAASFIFKHPAESLVSCFYRIRLDVFSPLLDCCEVCERVWKKKCPECKLVFCGKLHMRDHECIAIENVWG